MTAVRFNALTYANRLKDAGVEAKQAETMAQLQSELIPPIPLEDLVTKGDLKDLEVKLAKALYVHTFQIIGLMAGIQAIFHFIK